MNKTERINLLELLRKKERLQGDEQTNISFDSIGSYHLLDVDPKDPTVQAVRHKVPIFAEKQGEMRIVWCSGDVDAFIEEAAYRAHILHPSVVPVRELIVENNTLGIIEPVAKAKNIEAYCAVQTKEKVFSLLGELAQLFDTLYAKGVSLRWLPSTSILVHDDQILLQELGLWNRTSIPMTIRWLLSEAKRRHIPEYLATWGQLAIQLLKIEGEGTGGTPLVFSLLKGNAEGTLSCQDLLRGLQQRELKPIFQPREAWRVEGEREDVFRMALGTTLLVWSRIRTTQGSFFLLNTPLTQAHIEALGQNNPSHFSGVHKPAECMSLYDCMEICNLLSVVLGLDEVYLISKRGVRLIPDRIGVRLPTHEEWMYAAKADDPYVFAGSMHPKQCAWYEDTSQNQTAEVQQLQSNRFGLYDMSGNVWEWVYNPETNVGHGVGGSYRESYSGITLGATLLVENQTKRSDLGFRPLIPIFW